MTDTVFVELVVSGLVLLAVVSHFVEARIKRIGGDDADPR